MAPLTGRGWLLLLTSAAIGGAGVVFGISDLLGIGAALAILVGGSAFVAPRSKAHLLVVRRVQPDRIHAGHQIDVAVEITNRSSAMTGRVFAEEELPKSLSPKVTKMVEPIKAGGSRTIHYRINEARRGEYQLGPASILSSDPFGLSTSKGGWCAPTSVTVLPRIQTLDPTGAPPHHLSAGLRRRPSTAPGGEFFTLRGYVTGDDRKKIHWKASARRGELMVRQEELPTRLAATVLLDDRSSVHAALPGGPDSFEDAIESAASLLNMFLRMSLPTRLMKVTSPSLVPDALAGPGHYHRCLSALATAQVSSAPASIESFVQRALTASSGQVVLVTTGVEDALVRMCSKDAHRSARLTVICHELHTYIHLPRELAVRRTEAAMTNAERLARSGVRVLDVPAGSHLSDVWRGIGAEETGS